MNLPDGYTPHDGGDCPVDQDTWVDCIVRTGEVDGATGRLLLGHSGRCQAGGQWWRWDQHPGGIGVILGYHEALPAEDIDLYARWSEDA